MKNAIKALDTIASLDTTAIRDIKVELKKAREKFPLSTDSLPALMEEVGELSQSLLQHKHEPNKGQTHENIYAEAIQVAVMAIRIATEGDRNFPYHPESGSKGRDWDQYAPNPGEIKYPAKFICHWPGQSTACCERHGAQLEALARQMCCCAPMTEIAEPAECDNCVSEANATRE